jgi:hypothetical protein
MSVRFSTSAAAGMHPATAPSFGVRSAASEEVVGIRWAGISPAESQAVARGDMPALHEAHLIAVHWLRPWQCRRGWEIPASNEGYGDGKGCDFPVHGQDLSRSGWAAQHRSTSMSVNMGSSPSTRGTAARCVPSSKRYRGPGARHGCPNLLGGQGDLGIRTRHLGRLIDCGRREMRLQWWPCESHPYFGGRLISQTRERRLCRCAPARAVTGATLRQGTSRVECKMCAVEPSPIMMLLKPPAAPISAVAVHGR